jgi:hypothetical protein
VVAANHAAYNLYAVDPIRRTSSTLDFNFAGVGFSRILKNAIGASLAGTILSIEVFADCLN